MSNSAAQDVIRTPLEHRDCRGTGGNALIVWFARYQGNHADAGREDQPFENHRCLMQAVKGRPAGISGSKCLNRPTYGGADCLQLGCDSELREGRRQERLNEEQSEKRVKGQTKTGPPTRHAGGTDEEVMDEVEHAVPDEGNDYEP